ncbi:MAG: hypothetical protein AAFY26_03620 [Cyanobacteria bacterium J06638_22]
MAIAHSIVLIGCAASDGMVPTQMSCSIDGKVFDDRKLILHHTPELGHVQPQLWLGFHPF